MYICATNQQSTVSPRPSWWPCFPRFLVIDKLHPSLFNTPRVHHASQFHSNSTLQWATPSNSWRQSLHATLLRHSLQRQHVQHSSTARRTSTYSQCRHLAVAEPASRPAPGVVRQGPGVLHIARGGAWVAMFTIIARTRQHTSLFRPASISHASGFAWNRVQVPVSAAIDITQPTWLPRTVRTLPRGQQFPFYCP